MVAAGEEGVTPNDYQGFYWRDKAEMLHNSKVVMVAQLYEYTKHHWI